MKKVNNNFVKTYSKSLVKLFELITLRVSYTGLQTRLEPLKNFLNLLENVKFVFCIKTNKNQLFKTKFYIKSKKKDSGYKIYVIYSVSFFLLI